MYSTKSSLKSKSSLSAPAETQAFVGDSDIAADSEQEECSQDRPRPDSVASVFSSVSDSSVETGPLSTTSTEPPSSTPAKPQSSKSRQNTPLNHQFITPKPKRRRQSGNEENNVVETLLVQELAALAKEREALLAASKPDAISRIGEELAEGIRGFTDRYERAVVIKELRDVIFNRQFDPPINPRTTNRTQRTLFENVNPSPHHNIPQVPELGSNLDDADTSTTYNTGGLFMRSMDLLNK